jgi:predicted NBD/HSP70 family sugar kinase
VPPPDVAAELIALDLTWDIRADTLRQALANCQTQADLDRLLQDGRTMKLRDQARHVGGLEEQRRLEDWIGDAADRIRIATLFGEA